MTPSVNPAVGVASLALVVIGTGRIVFDADMLAPGALLGGSQEAKNVDQKPHAGTLNYFSDTGKHARNTSLPAMEEIRHGPSSQTPDETEALT